ncbi:MAG TPA: redoxin domain-containing protein [Cytophagaceae bacterium]|jgi:thiol-disulfide isomerase/thioredoxin|nr:redoxin domain-containing protein [Cytophagaceae bacterium]
MRLTRFVFFFSLSFSALASYGQLQHGEVLENFRLTNCVTGKPFDLEQEYDHNLLVLVFFAHDCPYSKIYTERIIKLAKNYDTKDVFIVAINPNSPALDSDASPEKMKKYAQSFPLPFPYLEDPQKNVSSKLHITKTPSVYVFKNISNKYAMQYRAAIDDAPEKEQAVTESYLAKAIDALLANKSFKYRYTEEVGCQIK